MVFLGTFLKSAMVFLGTFLKSAKFHHAIDSWKKAIGLSLFSTIPHKCDIVVSVCTKIFCEFFHF